MVWKSGGWGTTIHLACVVNVVEIYAVFVELVF